MRRSTIGPAMLLSVGVALFLAVVPRFLASSSATMPAATTHRASFDTIATDLSAYRWPIDETLSPTSVFGDFRTTHFHAGIDISTRGQEGFPVHAMREGYVSTVRVSPFGYGNVVEVTHPDGFTTWYAHLRGTADLIAQLVRVEQERLGRSAVELHLGPTAIPVNQGDVIAYTGSSGVGPAHLHFELRDTNGNPLDPFLAPQFSALGVDDAAPVIEEVGVLPLAAGTIIQGGATPVYQRPVRTQPRTFRLPQPIRITGMACLTARVRDGVGKRGFRNRVAHLELKIDGTTIYSAHISRLPADESKQIALHYDWTARAAGHPFHQKLFIEPGNRLPFYGKFPAGAGMLASAAYAEGEHTVDIIATDLNGNASRATGRVVFNHPPRITAEVLLGSIVIRSIGVSAPERILISSATDPKARHTYPVDVLTPTADSTGWILPGPPTSTLVITAANALGSVSAPVALSPRRTASAPIRMSHTLYRDMLIVSITATSPLTLDPSITVETRAGRVQYSTQRQSSTRFTALIPLNPSDGSEYDLRASTADGRYAAHERFEVHPVTPADGGMVATSDSSFVAWFGPEGVYAPLFVRLKEEAGFVRLEPGEILLDKGLTVSMRVPTSLSHRRVGMFLHTGGDRQLLGWRQADAGDRITGRTARFLGEFSLGVDEAPPSIERLSATYRRGTLRLYCRIRDNAAGTDMTSIQVRIGDTPVLAEYDPDRHALTYNGPINLPPGQYRLRVTATDRMQNAADRSIPLTIR